MIQKSNLRESGNRLLQETEDIKQVKSRRFGESFPGAFAFL